MEQSESATKELSSLLERFVTDVDEEEVTLEDEKGQEPTNLENKMDEAVNHGEPVRPQSFDAPDEAQQVIIETSERSAFRPSRRDTNSPEDFK